MTNTARGIATVPLVVLALVLGACATDDAAQPSEVATTAPADGSADGQDVSAHVDEMDDRHDDMAFGQPADGADADRTVAIEAGAPFVFDPDEVTVSVGETIAFEVTNSDTIAHDFTLGDEEVQEGHEAEMRAMEEMDGDMDHAEPNTVPLPAGETRTITWTFTEPGTVLYGCHEPGHYDAGMYGEVVVEG